MQLSKFYTYFQIQWCVCSCMCERPKGNAINVIKFISKLYEAEVIFYSIYS